MKKMFLNMFIVLLIPSFILTEVIGLSFSKGPYSIDILSRNHIILLITIFSVLAVLIWRSSFNLLSSIPNITQKSLNAWSFGTMLIMVIVGIYTFSSWFIKYSSKFTNEINSYSPATFMSQMVLESIIFTIFISVVISGIICIVKYKRKN